MPDQLKQYHENLSDDSRQAPIATLSGDALQAHLLKGVSRTFALTIPQLPSALRKVVSNAYLLCRTMDTIEDEPCLLPAQKRLFGQRLVGVVAGEHSAQQFAAELSPLLSASTIPDEHELIRCMPQVIAITLSFNESQREALLECVRVMSEGMVEFQHMQTAQGLRDLAQLNRYCYYVAGVVGEMLTRLFCDYLPALAQRREALMVLAVSFGQGLQMTNILKDIWDDKRRDACWLPQDIFSAAGFDLNELAPGNYRDSFGQGLGQLIAIAHAHLKDALAYTLLIPKNETGIREFCLWAIGMAMLTLRKINRHRDFTSGQQVKISRRSVKATILTSHLTVGNNLLLTAMFQLMGLSLPALTTSLAPSKANVND
ncbi:MAG: phytoene/squalene synthase family protein [Gammaproteobacteria bacterium]